MAEPTVEQMLTNVRTAMNDALVAGGAVEVELNGRRIRRDYTQLLEVEKRLMQRQNALQPAGSTRTLVQFERPR